MKQELQYLRDELNQMLQLHSEYANKTINMVLLIWGGALVFFGRGEIKFTEISLESILLYFMMATIFFVSNLILYYTARRCYNNTDAMSKLGAYIAVFYEKRPSKTVKVGENLCWELATFEMMALGWEEKSPYKRNVEYFALTLVSLVLMSFLLVPLVFNIFVKGGEVQRACIIASLICVVYVAISIRWICEIPKYTSSRDNNSMKVRHLKAFIQYALYTGHYTQEELKDRLGDIWDLIDVKIPITWKKAKKNN